VLDDFIFGGILRQLRRQSLDRLLRRAAVTPIAELLYGIEPNHPWRMLVPHNCHQGPDGFLGVWAS
jgi:hypothetical protein